MRKLFRTINSLLNADGSKGQKFQMLLRFIWVQLRFLLRKEFVFKWVNNTKLYAIQHRTSSTLCYYMGLFDPEEMSLIRDSIKPGDVFIDVGANIGSYSIFAASYGAEVYSFEPVPSTFELLERNIGLNPSIKERIHPVRKVISDKDGEVSFTTDNDTTNKIVTNSNSHTKSTGLARIPAVTLDSEVEKANFIKIDVEGFEKSVLGGAKRLLSSKELKLIVLEEPDDEIISILNYYDFSQCRYDCKTRQIRIVKGRQLKQNGIFVRQ